jgi:hypothetical protein
MASKNGSHRTLIGLGLGVGLFAWLTSLSDAAKPEDVFDEQLGSLGEIINYTYYTPPPASSAPPPSRYNTVSNDERATSGSEQPKREFTIWDSITKPSKKTRTSTPRTSATYSGRRTSPKQKRQTLPHHATSSSNSESDFNSPVPDASRAGSSPAPSNKPDEGADYSPLILGGAVFVVVVLLMSGRK